MGIKTEDFAKNLPPKEVTSGIDWLGILDAFDPTGLEQKFINECARRNPYATCYKWEEDGLAPEPIEKRMKSSESYLSFARRDLENCVARIKTEGLTPTVYASMSPPTKEFYKLLMEGKIQHGGNPVLAWMAGNVVVDTDPAGNIKCTKARSPEKIDGIVAAIMALDRCIRHQGETGGSVYDDPGHGLLVF